MASVIGRAVAGIGSRLAMIPVAVEEMGSISPRPHYVLPPSFAQTRGPNVSHKLPLDSHVNSIVMVRCSILCAHISSSSSLDSCQPPPNVAELADFSGQGLNVNGSICLNFVCQCVFQTPSCTTAIQSSSSGLRTLRLAINAK